MAFYATLEVFGWILQGMAKGCCLIRLHTVQNCQANRYITICIFHEIHKGGNCSPVIGFFRPYSGVSTTEGTDIAFS